MQKFTKEIVALFLVFSLNLVHSANLKKIEENLNDSLISTKITAKFTKTTALNPFKIYVSTLNGNVTLRGHVKDTAAYLKAIQLAKETKGVKAVRVKDLEIKPVNTRLADAYITAKVEAAILKTKLLDDESLPIVEISASTDNGNVTLSGSVRSQTTIDAIIKRVKNINGVKKVISKLTVQK